MTTTSTIPIALLNNVRLLRHLLQQRLDGADTLHRSASAVPPQPEEVYRFYARREFQQAFLHRDNEVFRSRWQHFHDRHEYRAGEPPVLVSLEALFSKFMETRNGELHIRLERYSEWQNVIANINFQPIVAYAMSQLRDEAAAGRCSPLEDQEAWSRSLLYPYDITVESYIRRHGLNDAHLHLNACAYAEYGWLYAICDPEEAYRHLLDHAPGKESRICQQFLEIYEDRSLDTLYRHLVIARNIRIILRNHVAYPPRFDGARYIGAALSFTKQGIHQSSLMSDLAYVTLHSNLDEPDWKNSEFAAIIHRERLWMSRLITDLSQERNRSGKVWLMRLFHIYILLMNEFCGLFIMKESQKGFSQFDNSQQVPSFITWHPNYYLECFKHFHGRELNSVTHFLDARIAPKDSAEKNEAALQPILKGYRDYLNWVAVNCGLPADESSDTGVNQLAQGIQRLQKQLYSRHIELNLTAHFIKEDWRWGDADDYRHHSYREKLKATRVALRKTFRNYPGVSRFLRAVDSANDEHHIPPSVLAPTFRYCRRWMGMDNITFHCGEYFPHLLTGLRALYDAYHCLGMKHGDRIGHATALGIGPRLWLDHVPRYLYVKREDRMLDLLFAFRILSHDCEVEPDAVCDIQDELLTLAHQLFDTCVPDFNLHDLESGMRLRKLAPEILFLLFGQAADSFTQRIREYKRDERAYRRLHTPVVTLVDDREWDFTIEELSKATARGIELALAWFSQRDVWQRGGEMLEIEVKRRHVPHFLKLQQYLMREFFEKGIVIETLMTSNLRIACYHQSREHHSMRWLLRHGPFANDPKVLLAFGSDDPGVFSCDVKSEFYLLYDSLRDHGVSEQEAIHLLHEANKRGRIYAFNHTNTWQAG